MSLSLFKNSRFLNKKPTARKIPSFHTKGCKNEKKSIIIHLDGKNLEFMEGGWKPITEFQENTPKEKEVSDLIKENKLLKLKNEVLLNMVAEATVLSNKKQMKIIELENLMTKCEINYTAEPDDDIFHISNEADAEYKRILNEKLKNIE